MLKLNMGITRITGQKDRYDCLDTASRIVKANMAPIIRGAADDAVISPMWNAIAVDTSVIILAWFVLDFRKSLTVCLNPTIFLSSIS